MRNELKAIKIMSHALLVTLGSIFVLVGTGSSFAKLATAQNIGGNEGFAKLCERKASQSKSIQYTIAVLMNQSGTSDCVIAEKHLNSLSNLAIHDKELVSLEPISGFKNLRSLSLWNNNISDLKPLSGLINLESLNLGENKITDISTLANLVHLKKLWLDSNRVTSISAIGLNHRLEILSMKANLLTDLSPIENLWRLKHFDSSLNPIVATSSSTLAKFTPVASRD